jgi:hypothetical protein
LRLASLDSRLDSVHILFRFFLIQHPHEPVRNVHIYDVYMYVRRWRCQWLVDMIKPPHWSNWMLLLFLDCAYSWMNRCWNNWRYCFWRIDDFLYGFNVLDPIIFTGMHTEDGSVYSVYYALIYIFPLCM